MFYRNVTGQVVVLPFLGLKSNQDPITSGASLTILKDGTSSSSAGTLTHVSGGVWKYAFTAGETDAEIVGMILTATDAMPVVMNLATDSSATAANMTLALECLGYLMAAEIGACADAGTAAETYAITINGATYTIDHTGLDATGNRGTATLTKT